MSSITKMENSGRAKFIIIFFTLSLLLCSAERFNEKDPTGNPNLTTFIKWLSAYYCLKNVSDVCPTKYTLKEDGWLNVSASDTQVFCAEGGCAEHTKRVLTCIHYVKLDYWFANGATVKDLNDTINVGCSQGFTGTSFYPPLKKKKN